MADIQKIFFEKVKKWFKNNKKNMIFNKNLSFFVFTLQYLLCFFFLIELSIFIVPFFYHNCLHKRHWTRMTLIPWNGDTSNNPKQIFIITLYYDCEPDDLSSAK